LGIISPLLFNTKFAENIAEQVFDHYFAGDFVEVVQRLADAHGH